MSNNVAMAIGTLAGCNLGAFMAYLGYPGYGLVAALVISGWIWR